MTNIEWVPQIIRPSRLEPGYLKTLGLKRHPFPVAPDDEHFYVSEHIEQTVAEIVHGIDARKGFMVISGDVGLGKTTITRRILHILDEQDVNTSFVFHTSLKDVDLLREINRDFGLPLQGQSNLGDELRRLNDFLLAQYRQGKNCAVIIDDAQNLDRTSLELVRMISNLETDRRKLVQILLVGQPELSQLLNMSELRQLKSRIFIEKSVRPLNRQELRTYVMFKLNLAGNQGRIAIADRAFARLHRYTNGNFRQINMLMDRCLYALCRDGASTIDVAIAKVAQADLNSKSGAWRGSAWRNGKRLALAGAATLFLVTALVTGRWWLTPASRTSGPAAANASSELMLASVALDSEQAEAAAERRYPIPVPDSADPIVDPAILAFLENSRLQAFAADFEQARSEGTLSAWAERILRKNGTQLVQLPAVSDALRRRYGALALPAPSGKGVTWLLFWKPALQIKSFYYGFQGEEIAALQRLLAARKLYNRSVDGIVGPHLMKALVTFQRANGLSVTGYPDAETLFVLHHPPEEFAS